MSTCRPLVRTIVQATLTASLCSPALATVSRVIAFGDSLSDTGNLYYLTKLFTGKGIPASPYADGRFSDGPLAVESLAKLLGVSLTSYAYGGATTGKANQGSPLLNGTGVAGQVDAFTIQLGEQQADRDALYFVWAGPNDFYSGDNIRDAATSLSASKNFLNDVRQLYAAGARQFLVPLMADLGSTPNALHNDASYVEAAQARTAEYNSLITLGLQSMQSQLSDLQLLMFDVPEFLRYKSEALLNQGFNVTDACYDSSTKTVCADSSTYLFWDDKHPTTVATSMLAKAFVRALREDTSIIPEPTTTIEWSIGLIALFGVPRASRQKKSATTAWVRRA